MFVDDIYDPVIIDGPWQTANNYSGTINSFDDIKIQA